MPLSMFQRIGVLLALTVLAAAWAVGSPAAPRAAAAAPRSAATPVSYLLAAQNADGGFGPGIHQRSSPLYSGWAALGLAAAGEKLANVRHHGQSLLHYLQDTPQGSDSGSLERTILALCAAGVRPHALLAELGNRIRRDGSVSGQTNLTAFAVLALRAAGMHPPARTIAWLTHQQDGDGGFNFDTGGQRTTSDVDDSGAVLEALAGTGQRQVINRVIRFLDRNQNPDGGFPSAPGGPSNAQSTAFAAQGLIAVGAPRPGYALAYLRSLTISDGSIDYARSDSLTPVWVTAQAEMALASRPLPLTGR